MTNDLHSAALRVDSREELARFVLRLRRDLLEGRRGWENPELGDFLEALSAWTADMPGYFEGRGEPVPDAPTWPLIATMLLAATTYE